MKIQFTGPEPTRAHAWDAGFDLTTPDEFEIGPDEEVFVHTGTRMAIPEGYVGMVCPRSGLTSKYSITVMNAPGIVDAGYTGEIVVHLVNHGDLEVAFDRGARIAQLVIVPIAQGVELERVRILEETERGEGGHGSTGA